MENLKIVVSADRFRKNVGDVKDLMASIEEYGQIRPILIDEKRNLIAGHRRLEACKNLGIKPITKVVNYTDTKSIEVHDNAFTKPYSPLEVYEIWQDIHATESKKPGPKDNNSVTNHNGLRPVDKAAIVTSMGTAKVSQIITIYESPFDEIKTKLNEEKISVYSAYNMVKKQIQIAEDLENEAKGKNRFDLDPCGYEEGMFSLPEKYSKHHHHHHIIEKTDHFPTLTTKTGFYHPALPIEGSTPKEFTLREYAGVQNFPDDFKFVGNSTIAIRKQIGNAVSPKMGEFVTKFLKGKTCGDLFAGCGGFSLGAHMNGIKTIWAMEWDVYAAKTYQINFPETKVYQENIKIMDPLGLGKVDIIICGPPCQGFSLAGHGFKDDPRNVLYKEVLRFVEALRPGEFIMENVPQILKIKDQIIRDFNEIGYDVETKLVKGEEIGMRQHRNRAFFIGTLRPQLESESMALAA